MVILCPDYRTRDLCAQVLHQRKMPVEMFRSPGDFGPTSDTIKVMTMRVSKGLEFPVVALAGVGRMPAKGEDEKEAARMFYVAATRATQRLMIEVDGGLGAGHRSSVYVLQCAVTSETKRSSTFAAMLPQSSHSTLCSLGIRCNLPAQYLTLVGIVRRPCDIAYNSLIKALQGDEK